MDNLTFFMAKTHAIIVPSSCSIRTFGGSIFLDLVFPFRWCKREVKGTFRNVLAFLKDVFPLFTQMFVTSLNCWFVHFPHITQQHNNNNNFINLWFGCGRPKHDVFFLQIIVAYHDNSMFVKHIQIHGQLGLFGPNFQCQMWGQDLGLIRGNLFSFQNRSHEYKNHVRSKQHVSECVSNSFIKKIKLENSKIINSHIMFAFVATMHVVTVNFKVWCNGRG